MLSCVANIAIVLCDVKCFLGNLRLHLTAKALDSRAIIAILNLICSRHVREHLRPSWAACRVILLVARNHTCTGGMT
jgi:hypothetical protein